VIGFLVGRPEAAGGPFGSGSLGDLTGSMDLELQAGDYDDEGLALSDQFDARGEDWLGTMAVEAGGDRTGAARLTSSASCGFTDVGPVVAHWWGTAELTLDGQWCTGTYGLSSYAHSGEGGGSMHLRCDDGSVLGAAIKESFDNPPSDDASATIAVTLTDGYFFER
jgi:hypothetical protein